MAVRSGEPLAGREKSSTNVGQMNVTGGYGLSA